MLERKIEEIKENLNKGKYEEVEKILMTTSGEKAKLILTDIADETESISVYSFCRYMAEKHKTDLWKDFQIAMLNNCPYIEGAYSVGLFHARQRLKENYNEENLEALLFFNIVPEKLLDNEEALEIAEEILKINSKNPRALEIKHKYSK